MTTIDIIRTRKDEAFANHLNMVELSDAEMEDLQGGTPQRVDFYESGVIKSVSTGETESQSSSSELAFLPSGSLALV